MIAIWYCLQRNKMKWRNKVLVLLLLFVAQKTVKSVHFMFISISYVSGSILRLQQQIHYSDITDTISDRANGFHI